MCTCIAFDSVRTSSGVSGDPVLCAWIGVASAGRRRIWCSVSAEAQQTLDNAKKHRSLADLPVLADHAESKKQGCVAGLFSAFLRPKNEPLLLSFFESL